MNPIEAFVLQQKLEAMKNACQIDSERFHARLELTRKVSHIRNAVCHPKCMFSRTCGKTNEQVMDCSTVKKYLQIPGGQP